MGHNGPPHGWATSLGKPRAHPIDHRSVAPHARHIAPTSSGWADVWRLTAAPRRMRGDDGSASKEAQIGGARSARKLARDGESGDRPGWRLTQAPTFDNQLGTARFEGRRIGLRMARRSPATEPTPPSTSRFSASSPDRAPTTGPSSRSAAVRAAAPIGPARCPGQGRAGSRRRRTRRRPG
jgi:hypothetical protein